ncbi:AMP-binding protein [Staphylococcus saprophyticus]|uniref:AMP-binding protein n=1 Tax=Staphylococcus saprophyticus TaxID=29385 RepID=UPI0009909F0B|nr:AMP-binding protein [Staphylococcus saprophyticus]MDW4410214.1 AMP-binding protein [Staphylococcus saprophyticus]
MELLKKMDDYAKKQPNQYALDFGRDKQTYAGLVQNMKWYKQQFQHIPQYSYVGLLIEDPLTTIELYLTMLHHQCIPCILDYRWSEEQIKTLIDHYGIPFLINSELEVIKTQNEQGQLKWHEDVLHIGFTSGTTGLPKAYYRNELSWIYSYEETEKLMKTEIDTMIAPGPLSHSLSLFVCVFALYTGRTFIGQQQFDAQTLADMMQNNHTIHHCALFVVPTMLDAYVSGQLEIQQIRYIFSTGDKLPYSLRNRVATHFPNATLIEFFGTSEASFISYNYDNEAPSHSVGKLFPNVKIDLEQPDDKGIGKLKVKSNMVFSGYVDDAHQSDCWIGIGDFASMDAHNYLYLHGREHDRMIIGGRNVYPIEVERAVQDFESFHEVLVISAPHTKFGEIAVLLYTGTEHVTYSGLRAFLSKRLARYQIPSKLLKIEKMEHTQSGKIARETMKQRYMKGAL